jgi:Zn finger protein HypA/HybF involved in hydrogenase expression
MMTSDEQQLDGNAAGGILGQIFAFEMTMAEVICAHCDAVGPIGAATVFATAMGTIVRCPGCGAALIRIAHGPQRYWVDFSGTRLLQINHHTW